MARGNVKKCNRFELAKQRLNFAGTSRFFCSFLIAVPTRLYDLKMSKFLVLGRTETRNDEIFFLFLNLIGSFVPKNSTGAQFLQSKLIS